MTDFKEERLRKVAEKIDPEAWAKFDFYQSQAKACVGLGHEETADLWIGLSHETVSASLTKASEIEAEYAEEIGRLRQALDRIARCDSFTDKWGTYIGQSGRIASEALALSTVVGGDSSSNEDHGSSRRHDDPIAGPAP